MLACCTSSRIVDELCVVNNVSFQPFRGKENEDRAATQLWEVRGHKWLFLAVFDGQSLKSSFLPTAYTSRQSTGHGGSVTSEYAAGVLPGNIRSALTSTLDVNFQGDVENSQLLSKSVGRMLATEIKAFDVALGQSVKDLIPHPRSMTEEDIKRVIHENEGALLRAYFGSTLAGALVNLSLKYMWSFGLGDSTTSMLPMSSEF